MRRAGGRFAAGRTRGGAAAQVQGRWCETAPLFAGPADPGTRRRARAELLLERYGIVTREQVLAEGIAGGFSAVYPELARLETLGAARRGYFVEGLGGAQFALSGAVERLRACAGQAAGATAAEPPVVLAAVDPAQPYGSALPWPERVREAGTGRGGAAGRGKGGGSRGPARAAGAYVVLAGGEPILYLERGGRALLTLVAADDGRLRPALAALVDHLRSGVLRRVALEKVDGEPALTCALSPILAELGFQEGPRRLTLPA